MLEMVFVYSSNRCVTQWLGWCVLDEGVASSALLVVALRREGTRQICVLVELKRRNSHFQIKMISTGLYRLAVITRWPLMRLNKVSKVGYEGNSRYEPSNHLLGSSGLWLGTRTNLVSPNPSFQSPVFPSFRRKESACSTDS